jgi:hypothetical protein
MALKEVSSPAPQPPRNLTVFEPEEPELDEEPQADRNVASRTAIPMIEKYLFAMFLMVWSF